ncbi:UDP-N-acetylenolpyruvoylglucosamine reductase [Clostridium tetani]|uniref:UDP-N-acetylmuramate dehydrogenase n=1 Tax=Clostridium tetani TaxID=1513 RepID=UPI000512AC76|nr:UDP-N-acetylmuramate dehydrogenase [Clostridium tetani]AVP54626.1 UDP-N-acetylmuramate dehydrogenase [Clostridium tetani]KGI36776.1 UDP-N-acetylenolpyruvoylglucosamine reductase [Clostridium tetani ATCC 9441]KGI43298.1 UDP-N-acetylenolpyruvoylglucosamine reductase [Clostridium tetani]KGI44108.1 UDP-N-acetylenolpyruvoylglucosamine reductase [Clostridium tetani]KHO30967.1 UDP-N-acetylenolpyruvoylglucosamine reductase [Clostridium tetani]
MNHYKDFISNLIENLGSENVKTNELMKNHTSFKVGGPVDILVTPESYEQVQYVIKHSRGNNIPYFIMGNGSNLLVRDGGIRGLVIKFCKLNRIKIEDDKIIAQSGVLLSKVSNMAAKNNLEGLEFASGIPGSIGGALTMNAGAYNGEISQVIDSALVLDKSGEILNLSKEELELGYRTSSILKNGYVVLEAILKLSLGDSKNIYDRIKELTEKRKTKQPLEYPSAGSTFKRPQGYFAAKLIEESGLKGINVGDAEVSQKHSGFIINKGNASAKDILNLINIVQDTVKSKFDVELHTEVLIIGEDKLN